MRLRCKHGTPDGVGDRFAGISLLQHKETGTGNDKGPSFANQLLQQTPLAVQAVILLGKDEIFSGLEILSSQGDAFRVSSQVVFPDNSILDHDGPDVKQLE